MKTLPSKELLETVLGKKIQELEDGLYCHFDGRYLQVAYLYVEDNINPDVLPYINIHELAHMVKEWACKQGNYFIFTRSNVSTSNLSVGAIAYISDDFYIDGMWKSNVWNTYKGHTETEAIFKAGEWVLKEISK